MEVNAICPLQGHNNEIYISIIHQLNIRYYLFQAIFGIPTHVALTVLGQFSLAHLHETYDE